MCKYCNLEGVGREPLYDKDEEYIYIESNKYKEYWIDADVDRVNFEIEINYCPKCGRKLGVD